MNKTVNINLANIFFHIDEEAYGKLRRYLEAIKRSFSSTTGSDEILSDIEARIAELFHEKMENDRQVITLKEVDEVITVMGQPEDYQIDEDIFEDEPRSASKEPARNTKKLYRDTETKYIGGVCSGLEHYLGIDALWIRLIFILLGVFTGFGFIAYILLWILVPEAASTSQKLDMRGQAVNISNIERKVKEGFEGVADKVKNVDYEKVGNTVKDGSKSFFETLGDIILFFIKIIGKFIGIILIITGAATLIALFIGMFTVGILDAVSIPGLDFYELVNTSGLPVWLISILIFFAVGIPFFFLLYLGLKILVNNLKSIGNIAKFSLLGLWLIAVIVLSVFGIKEAIEHSHTGSSSSREILYTEAKVDTLLIDMRTTDLYDQREIEIDGLALTYTESGEKLLLSDNVRFDMRKADDAALELKVRKDADGSSFRQASERAANVDYSYTLEGSTLFLNDYFTTPSENKVRDQKVRLTLYIPENTVVQFNERTKYHFGRTPKTDKNVYGSNIANYTWKMNADGLLVCQGCPDTLEDRWDRNEDEDSSIIIDENGIDINIKDGEESVKVKVNEDGIEFKAKAKDE